MIYLILLLLLSVLFGLIGVAAHPAPYYGAGGLVLAALAGCGVLVGLGGSFVGMVLFLIYLGGMLVVFAYSVALAAEAYPVAWGEGGVVVYVVGYVVVVMFFGVMLVEGPVLGGLGVMGLDSGGLLGLRGDFGGVVLLFSVGGAFLLLCGWGLVLALFVVLELTRGRVRGALRVP